MDPHFDRNLDWMQQCGCEVRAECLQLGTGASTVEDVLKVVHALMGLRESLEQVELALLLRADELSGRFGLTIPPAPGRPTSERSVAS